MAEGQPVQDLVDAKYGENRDYQAQQQVMPAAAAQGMPPSPSPNQIAGAGQQEPLPDERPAAEPLSPFMAPTSRPGEPVTAGAPLGAGPNSMRLGPQAPLAPNALSRTLSQYASADDTGVIASLANYFDEMNI